MKIKHPILIIIILTLIVIIAGMFFYINPEESQLFPKCYFYRITGYKCIGCGTQRALHHLFHLRITQALSHNPLIVLSFPYAGLLIYNQYLGGKEKHPKLDRALSSSTSIYIVLTIIAIYWIARNIMGV